MNAIAFLSGQSLDGISVSPSTVDVILINYNTKCISGHSQGDRLSFHLSLWAQAVQILIKNNFISISQLLTQIQMLVAVGK